MSDRELLELAAKAAGVEIKTVIGGTFWTPDGCVWNPLTDDADALRLAVKLELIVDVGPAVVKVMAPRNKAVYVDVDGNALLATRRAIVMAAAAEHATHTAAQAATDQKG